MIDVSNPANPRYAGTYTTRGFARRVAVSGNQAYVADGHRWTGSNYVGSFEIIDVSNPTNPRGLGRLDIPGYAYDVAVSGNYAYVANAHGGLQVVDVSNPVSPRRVGGNFAPDPAHGVFLTERHAFVAARGRGLFVLNLFTPISGPVLLFGPLPQMEQNSVRISVQGLPGLRVEVERSADLVNWHQWTNATLGNSPLEFQDDNLDLRQFYRALAP